MSLKKLIIALSLIIIIAAFYALDLGTYFSFDYIKSQQASFQNFYEENPVLTIAIFFTIYVVSAAVSFPGASILTVLAGALFGLWWGTVIVSFASTIGATMAFWIARVLMKDFVQQKFSEWLQPINEGIRKEGAFYLFTLRLVPVFPFFAINLLMGLTPISTFTFFWVSQVGMLLGTAVYVNAGAQLAELDSLEGILSVELILALVLLGVFPLIAKKAIEKIKQIKSIDVNEEQA